MIESELNALLPALQSLQTASLNGAMSPVCESGMLPGQAELDANCLCCMTGSLKFAMAGFWVHQEDCLAAAMVTRTAPYVRCLHCQTSHMATLHSAFSRRSLHQHCQGLELSPT